MITKRIKISALIRRIFSVPTRLVLSFKIESKKEYIKDYI